MKTSLILICMALFVVATFAADDCNPNGNGMPTCTGTSTVRYRNFFDPTRYWQCQGNSAIVVLCDDQTGFDPVTSQCVPWANWVWYPPCPDN